MSCPENNELPEPRETPAPDTRGTVGKEATYADNHEGRFFFEPWLKDQPRPCPQVNYNP